MLDELWAYALTQPWGHYLTTLAAISYVFALVVPYLPVKLTSRVPDWVMRVVNFIAAKSAFAKAADKAKLTDHNGNSRV